MSANNPQHVTLVADTDTTVTLDANYTRVQVTMTANPALTYFNTRSAAISTTGGTLASLAGNHAMPAVLCSLNVADETSTTSVVHLRSVGTPTVTVLGL